MAWEFSSIISQTSIDNATHYTVSIKKVEIIEERIVNITLPNGTTNTEVEQAVETFINTGLIE